MNEYFLKPFDLRDPFWRYREKNVHEKQISKELNRRNKFTENILFGTKKYGRSLF